MPPLDLLPPPDLKTSASDLSTALAAGRVGELSTQKPAGQAVRVSHRVPEWPSSPTHVQEIRHAKYRTQVYNTQYHRSYQNARVWDCSTIGHLSARLCTDAESVRTPGVESIAEWGGSFRCGRYSPG